MVILEGVFVITGIYLIENLANGKKYIGQSVDVEKRWKNHLSAAFNINEKVYGYPLYRAIRKYGKDNFKFSMIEECNKEELNDKEIYWIAKMVPEYNQTRGGNQYVSGKKLRVEDVKKIQKILIDDKEYRYSNVEIAKEYGILPQTISRINRGELWKDDNLKYPLRDIKARKNKSFYCVDCGKLIGYGSLRCKHCAAIHRMENKKFDASDRNQIKEVIRKSGSYRQAAKTIGVSNSGLKIICNRFNLPINKEIVNSYSDAEWVKV